MDGNKVLGLIRVHLASLGVEVEDEQAAQVATVQFLSTAETQLKIVMGSNENRFLSHLPLR